jgi:hypothetical protein
MEYDSLLPLAIIGLGFGVLIFGIAKIRKW